MIQAGVPRCFRWNRGRECEALTAYRAKRLECVRLQRRWRWARFNDDRHQKAAINRRTPNASRHSITPKAAVLRGGLANEREGAAQA